MSSHRPQRLCLTDFLGKACTLPQGAASYERLDANTEVKIHVLLGTAGIWGQKKLEDTLPHKDMLEKSCSVYVVEAPDFLPILKAQDAALYPDFPDHWKKTTFAQHAQRAQQQMRHHEWGQWLKELHQDGPVALWWYRYNERLNPNFWSPLLGQILALQSKEITCGLEHQYPKALPKVLLGCAHGQLLERELTQAFTELGYEVIPVRQGGFHSLLSFAQNQNSSLLHTLHEKSTALFFSLNGQGLDREGRDFALLEALNIPLALWFVDNPWHMLAALRLPWWKKAHLFTTDASFMPLLQAEGAQWVNHMPLATAQHMWQGFEAQQQYRNTPQIQAASKAPCIFVGRAAFPQKQAFFAAAKVDATLLNTAQAYIDAGTNTPHYHWWAEQMHITSFWQNPALRSLGFGAEQSAQCQRVHWLQSLQEENLAIFGDSATWQSLLPKASAYTFCPELDYYGMLSAVYAAAPSVLNVTSLLLPAGLTQRHFDVWAAGGFLWTNTTAGLDIFPQELVKAIAFTTPEDMKKAMHALSPNAMQELKQGWQEELRTKHSYVTRIYTLLGKI